MKPFYRIISFILCCVMVFSLCACKPSAGDSSNPETPPAQEQTPSGGNEENGPSTDDVLESFATTISYDPEDYIGDLETFVYGLLITKLEYIYDVFPAYIQLSSGYFVYGLAYTDYSECYTNEDESVAYFMSGFLPFVGELDIPQEDFDSGLYLYNLDYQDEETFFVWKYKSDAFLEHCVVYGAYLQYGVDTSGQITYNAIPFEREKCDTSLGSLYSYDDSRYLYDVDFGDYMPISGISLAETFDYEEFEKEVNAFIEEQNANWMTYDVETVAYNSQEAVEAYLLSLQEETFLGYPVEQLVAATKDLDPLQCFRITPEGLSVIDIQEIPPEQPSALCKWLVGAACAIGVVGGIVVSYASNLLPPPWSTVVRGVGGALTGASFDVFFQVIVDNKTLGDVQWAKVAVSAVSGAISALIYPYVGAKSGLGFKLADMGIDGALAGLENAVFAFIDGGTFQDAAVKFGEGFVIGAAISGVFKVIEKGVSKINSARMGKLAKKVSDELAPKVAKTASKISSEVADSSSNAIGGFFKKLKNKSDDLFYRLKYGISRAEFDKIVELSAKRGDVILEAPIKALRKNFNQLTKKGFESVNGKTINKFADFLELVAENENGDVLGRYIVKNNGVDEVIAVFKRNGVADLEFDITKYLKVFPENLTTNRDNNFVQAAQLYREAWLNNKIKIPKEIENSLLEAFPGYKNIDDLLEFADSNLVDKKMVDIVKKSSWVFHEGLDGSVSLVPRALHDKVKGYHGISHMGLVSYLKTLKSTYGTENFSDYLTAVANGYKLGFSNAIGG